jgi:prevent-host-death family protein
MATVSVYNARAEFSRLIERALAGEEIVITRRGKPAVRLVPVAEALQPRKPGALKGLFEVTDEFFECPTRSWRRSTTARSNPKRGTRQVRRRTMRVLLDSHTLLWWLTGDPGFRAARWK